MKLISLFFSLAIGASASIEIIEQPHSISAQLDGTVLWTHHHDPAEGKPYIHPLTSTGGTTFTDLRPEDHPWHRGLWFSWKFINGVNYWEENRETGKSQGETRITKVVRTFTKENSVHLQLELEYAPAGSNDIVLKENRTLAISAPDTDGSYRIDWSGTFTAQDKDVFLDRTPIPGEPNGKSYGGYAGWSVRMNPAMKPGCFVDSTGKTNAWGQAPEWTAFQHTENGGLIFKDHPGNLNYPSKWYVAPGMPYFSPAVLFDAPHTIKSGESMTLHYSLVVCPAKKALEQANAKRKKVVILSGSNNHYWKATTPALKEMLEGAGSFEVDVVIDPEKLTADFLKHYDVLLSNWNGFGKNKPAEWSEELKKAYVDFVRNGGGHLVVHAGSSSFYDWEDYHAICLATWKIGETNHGQQHEFVVQPTAADHPITKGFMPMNTVDELWRKPLVHPAATVIAESFSKQTGNGEPSALVGTLGQGRCYCLLLGHGVEQMNQPAFKALFLQGVDRASRAEISPKSK